jgi:hypothetical protein
VTKLPKFLALAALLSGCGDYARTGTSPADILYFPTGIAVGHVPAGCQGGTAGCQTRLYVASSNFDLRYDLDTGGALTTLDPDTARRVGEPVRMGSFAGDVALVDSTTCAGWTADPVVLVTSRSAGRLYGLSVGADGTAACGADCARSLDVHLRDPFGLALSCRGAGDATAWVSFLGEYKGLGWVQPVALPGLAAGELQTLGSFLPTQAMAYDPVRDRIYSVTTFSGPNSRLYYASATEASVSGSALISATGEATSLAISADGTRAYVGMRLFNGAIGSTSRPVDVGGALAVVDLEETAAGGPRGTLLRLVPTGLGPSTVRAVDRRSLGLRDLVAVTCADDSSFHLYDDEVGSVVSAIGADSLGAPILGRRLFGLAVEAPYQSATSASAARFFVASFDDGTVSSIVVNDPASPGNVSIQATGLTPRNP